MISENARNYENVVIRNEQEVGINNFGLDYMVGLEDEIERLNNIINNAKDNIEELKDRAKEVSWVEMRSEVYCEELDSIFELRGE